MRTRCLPILIWLCACGALQAGDLPAENSDVARKPNLLVILADDFGPDLVGAYQQVLLKQRDKRYPDCPSDPDCRPDPPCTPHLDDLAARGILFSRAWANPLCSPTRAMILTGKYAFRNGIGRNTERVPLRFPDPSLAWRLGDVGYNTAAIGKWHLESLSDAYNFDVATERFAIDAAASRCPGKEEFRGAGFDVRLGSEFNLQRVLSKETEGGSYRRWEKNFNGKPIADYCRYATVDTIEDAIALIDPAVPLPCLDPAALPCLQGEDGPLCDPISFGRRDPWFLYVALNAPHSPVHTADPNQCPSTGGDSCYVCDDPVDPNDIAYQQVRMMTEVMDHQIGRLMQHVNLDTTYVIFLGDNGTMPEAISPVAKFAGDPLDPCVGRRGKGSLYEGGVHVPLLIAGPGIAPGGQCDAMVSAVDVYATALELAGVLSDTPDSESMVPYLWNPKHPSLRQYNYAERFSDSFDAVCERMPRQRRYVRALQGKRFKLIRQERGDREDSCPPINRVELYDIANDPFEEDNLLFNPDKLENPTVLPPATIDDYCELRCQMIRMGVDRDRAADVCNCCIGLDDLANVLLQLGCEDDCATCTGDVTGDCTVDLTDLANVLANFGSCE